MSQYEENGVLSSIWRSVVLVFVISLPVVGSFVLLVVAKKNSQAAAVTVVALLLRGLLFASALSLFPSSPSILTTSGVLLGIACFILSLRYSSYRLLCLVHGRMRAEVCKRKWCAQ